MYYQTVDTSMQTQDPTAQELLVGKSVLTINRIAPPVYIHAHHGGIV